MQDPNDEPQPEPVLPPLPEPEPDEPDTPLTPTGRQKQADERGYVELTPAERQVSVNLHKAVNTVMVEANAIMEGRYKSIALTHLETALMFFNKAIAVDGTK